MRNLRTVEVKPWARRGGNAVFVNHDASRVSNDSYVMEIPPGKKLEPHRQLFEEMILILEGRGSTTVWNNEGKRITFEWKAGSLFAIPLNAWHQHFNGSGTQAARYVGVTNAPPVVNLYEDLDFLFNCDHDFKNRFNGEPDYFSAKGEQKGLLLQTNFVADAINLPLISAKERGAGGGHIRFSMAKGSMNSHISQFPVGTYKKGHAHGPGAYVIILSGEGYSLMWPEGEEPKRYDWEVGTLIVPPNMWFHQHFNSGTTPARYLALKHEVVSIRNAPGRAQGVDQPAHRRRPDRLRRREAAGAHHVLRRARQARPHPAHGPGLCAGAARPAAGSPRSAKPTPTAPRHSPAPITRSAPVLFWHFHPMTVTPASKGDGPALDATGADPSRLARSQAAARSRLRMTGRDSGASNYLAAGVRLPSNTQWHMLTANDRGRQPDAARGENVRCSVASCCRSALLAPSASPGARATASPTLAELAMYTGADRTAAADRRRQEGGRASPSTRR